MNFLFPLYLLGAAAIAIPILLHLRRRPPQNAVPFSALMFLEASPVPPVKRRRLEDLLLLLLRCLALLLLALLFSRPLWRTPAVAGTSHDGVVILLDRSASMQRDDLSAALTRQLDAALAQVREEDDVSLVTYEREPTVALSAVAWRALPLGERKALLRQQALQIPPTWGGTDLGKALVFTSGLLDAESSTLGSRRILLISDMQEGSALEALGVHAWPQEVAVSLFPVTSPNASNLTLSPAARLTHDEGGAPGTPARGSRIRVLNSKGSALDKFSLAWVGQPASKTEAALAAGASRIMPAPARTSETEDGTLEISGDTVPFDNRAWFARQTPRKVRVLVITDKASTTDVASPLFYLSKALRPGVTLSPSLVVKSPSEMLPRDLAETDFCVVTAPLPAPASTSLQAWLHEGHALLYVARPSDDGASLAALTGVTRVGMKESTGDYAMLTELDFEQPVLKPFADSGVRDFSKVRFWKHRVMDLPAGARRLAAFDDGSPAWIDMSVGKGRVFAFASGWTPAESQLAVSSKFVPLLYSMLDAVGFASSPDQGYVVGDAIPLEPSLQLAALKVLTPSGRTVSWDGESEPVFTATTHPGIYVLGEGPQSRAYAVNLAPNEGRIAPLDLERLKEYGVRLVGDSPDAATVSPAQMSVASLQDLERERSQKLWKVFAAVLLGALLLETLVAALRESRPPQPVTP